MNRAYTRAVAWTVCVVGQAAVDKRYVIVKCGSPRRGYAVFKTDDELLAHMVMEAGSFPAPDGTRIPSSGSVIGQRRSLEALAEKILRARSKEAA